MPYNYEKLRRLPVDDRIVDRISRDPKLLAEQGSRFMYAYGGAAQYITFARLPTNERLTYAAVLDGYSATQDIADVTGLEPAEVSSAISKLAKKGLVEKAAGESIPAA